MEKTRNSTPQALYWAMRHTIQYSRALVLYNDVSTVVSSVSRPTEIENVNKRNGCREKIAPLTLSIEFPDYSVYKCVLWGNVAPPYWHVWSLWILHMLGRERELQSTSGQYYSTSTVPSLSTAQCLLLLPSSPRIQWLFQCIYNPLSKRNMYTVFRFVLYYPEACDDNCRTMFWCRFVREWVHMPARWQIEWVLLVRGEWLSRSTLFTSLCQCARLPAAHGLFPLSQCFASAQ